MTRLLGFFCNGFHSILRILMTSALVRFTDSIQQQERNAQIIIFTLVAMNCFESEYLGMCWCTCSRSFKNWDNLTIIKKTMTQRGRDMGSGIIPLAVHRGQKRVYSGILKT